MAHFPGVILVIAADAENARDGEKRVEADDGNGRDRPADQRRNLVIVLLLLLFALIRAGNP